MSKALITEITYDDCYLNNGDCCLNDYTTTCWDPVETCWLKFKDYIKNKKQQKKKQKKTINGHCFLCNLYIFVLFPIYILYTYLFGYNTFGVHL